MMYTTAASLFVLWLTGLITSFTMGGFIHVLLAMAILIALLQLMRRHYSLGAK